MGDSVSIIAAILVCICLIESLEGKPSLSTQKSHHSRRKRNSPYTAKYYSDDGAPEINDKELIYRGGPAYYFSFDQDNVTKGPPGELQPLYRWTFASDDCMPEITCSRFRLFQPGMDGQCLMQYMEVTDGVKSSQRFCGHEGPKHTVGTPSDGVRDIYVTFRNYKADFPVHFECRVACGEREKAQIMRTPVKAKHDDFCTCGRKPNNHRVIGGEETYAGEFPWIAAMVVAHTRQPYCIGSVINDRMILTAAHCFKGKYKLPETSQIILNAYFLDPMPNIHIIKGAQFMRYDPETLARLDSGNASFRFDVEEIIIHPLYSLENSDFDTALILLAAPIQKYLLPVYSPICLPNLKYKIDSYSGWNAAISGWGLPSSTASGTLTEMKQIEVEIIDPEECLDYFGRRYASPRRQLCAAHPNSTQDSCAGDSGGPIIIQYRPQVWVQVGIISWGDGCAIKGKPGVYYRTTSTNQWIRYWSNIKGAVWCTAPT